MSYAFLKYARAGLALGLMFMLFTAENCSVGPAAPPVLRTHFNSPFPRRGTNLTKALGSDIQIKRNGLAYAFHLEYYKADRTTLITNTDGDTVYNDEVLRHRGLFFFHQEKVANRYWMSAMFVRDSFITGFLDFENQMQLIQDSLEHFETIQPDQWPEDILQLDSNVILIGTDKHSTHRLFDIILESSDTCTFRRLEETTLYKAKDELDDDPLAKKVESELVSSFGPVPANERIKVTLNTTDLQALHSFHIHDLNGKEVYTSQVKGAVHEIETRTLQAGTFIFTVVSGAKTWSRQFVVVH